MSDLSDERVREMIATAERAEVPGWVQLQPVTFIALAREVLALRERVAELERVNRLDSEELAASTARLAHLRREAADLHTALAGNEITIATLTRQRDGYAEVAREALDLVDRVVVGPFTDDDEQARAELRARLAALQEGTDAHS